MPSAQDTGQEQGGKVLPLGEIQAKHRLYLLLSSVTEDKSHLETEHHRKLSLGTSPAGISRWLLGTALKDQGDKWQALEGVSTWHQGQDPFHV